MPRMATRKGSSRVRMGWTVLRRPKWRAVNCKRKAAIMKTKPASQTLRSQGVGHEAQAQGGFARGRTPLPCVGGWW